MKSEQLRGCAVTIMPVSLWTGVPKIGFIRREPGDTFGGLLVAPGGKISAEDTQWDVVDGVPYYVVEQAAIRELSEETGLLVSRHDLKFFCSLLMPSNRRLVVSFYCFIVGTLALGTDVVWLGRDEIEGLRDDDFAPGMRWEALELLRRIAK